ALKTSEEEESILDNRSPYRSAVVIAFQRVPFQSECIAGIERSIAYEFKEVAVKIVGARLCYRVDCARRVLSILRRYRAGLDFELLQCIRKRQRQTHAIERILMCASVQQECQPVVHPARDGTGIRRVIPVGHWIPAADS